MTEDHQKYVFTTNLNRLLDERGKSQKEIADAIGVSPQTFNTWCKGIAMPRMGKLQKLADYFMVNKSDLIEEPAASASPDSARQLAVALTEREAEHLRRYRYIDEEGRKWVDATLDREYDRCAAEKGNASIA